jgi:hypothetical protein
MKKYYYELDPSEIYFYLNFLDKKLINKIKSNFMIDDNDIEKEEEKDKYGCIFTVCVKYQQEELFTEFLQFEGFSQIEETLDFYKKIY